MTEIESPPLSGPLVTVFALCYNHQRFLLECLESIRCQTYSNFELIIIDDCSADNSVAMIEHWIKRNSVQCKFIKHTANLGICRTLNDCLAISKGKYISMIATDDVWLPEKVAAQVELMEKLPETVGVLYGDAMQIDENGGPLPLTLIQSHASFQTPPSGNIHNVLWNTNFIPAMSTLIRRSCFAVVGTYDEDLSYEDYEMWLRISKRFEFGYCDKVLAKYRIVSNSLTRRGGKARHLSNEKICLKFLSSGDMEPGLARRVRRKYLVLRSRRAYEEKSPNRNRLLWNSLLSTPDPRILAMLLFSVFGVPCSFYERLTHTYRSIMDKISAQQDPSARIS